MAVQPGVWGIDLGQCALKALRLEVQSTGRSSATAFDYVEHPKILSQPDADPDQLTREALEKFLSRNTLKGDVVAISVPGQSGLARFVKLPPVEEKKIGDIVKFEAKQQIPFNLDEVVWDYQKVSLRHRHRRLRPGDRDRPVRHEARHGQPLLAALQGRQRRGPHRPDGPAGACATTSPTTCSTSAPTPRAPRTAAARSSASSPWTSAPTSSNLIITDGAAHHLAAAHSAGRQPLHPRPDQGPQAHLRQGRAPQAQRHQVRPELKKILTVAQAGAQRLRRRGAALAGLLHQHAPRRHRSST